MLLGTLDLRRRQIGLLDEAALRRAYMAPEPDRSLVALAALGLLCEGPPDWPAPKGSYIDQGRLLMAYLSIQGIKIGEAVLVGTLAIQGIPDPTTTLERAREIAGFFGVTLPSGLVSSSAGGGKAAPSAD